jgi:hypothetical protein
LVARVKITSYNHHRSAPFFRALVVSATKSTREKEPTTSSNQPEGFATRQKGSPPALDEGADRRHLTIQSPNDAKAHCHAN